MTLHSMHHGGATRNKLVRVASAGFGEAPRGRLPAAAPPLPGGCDVAFAWADARPESITAARDWLRRACAAQGLAVLLAPPSAGGAGAADAVRLELPADAAERLPVAATIDGLTLLLTETGAVCVEPDDLRFALGRGGRVALAAVAAHGSERAPRALDELFARLAAQGAEPGRYRRVAVAVLTDTELPSAEFELIHERIRRWLHPAGLPLLGARRGAGAAGWLEIRALAVADT